MKQSYYQTTGFIVVKHDLSPEVTTFSVTSVHEFPGLLVSVLNVISAASPFPIAIRRYAYSQIMR